MKITIRPLEEKDAYTSWRWRNDPEVFANTVRRYSGPVTLEDELNWIRIVLKRPDERRFAIMADDVYIGNVYLTSIHDNQGEISTLIGDKNYWNKGIGYYAKKWIIEYGFNVLKLNKIISLIVSSNIYSIKINKKIGFKEIKKDRNIITFMLTPNLLYK